MAQEKAAIIFTKGREYKGESDDDDDDDDDGVDEGEEGGLIDCSISSSSCIGNSE